LKCRLCAPVDFTGGRFSTSPLRKPESVKGSAQSTDRKRDDSKRCHVSGNNVLESAVIPGSGFGIADDPTGVRRRELFQPFG